MLTCWPDRFAAASARQRCDPVHAIFCSCAQLVRIINAKCAEVESLALQLDDSKKVADSTLAQLDATRHECEQLCTQLVEKQSVVEALQRQLYTCEDSLAKALKCTAGQLAAADISAEQANLHKENMQQQIARMAREMDELRTKNDERLAAMQGQYQELCDANQRATDAAAKVQRLELELHECKENIKTRDEQMLDMTDKMMLTKEQWVLEKEATNAALKSANDKHADTKKQMAALRDLKVSFAERAKEAEAANAAAEQKLDKAMKELQSLRPGTSAPRTSPRIQSRGAKNSGRISREGSPAMMTANKEASRTERMRHLVLERDGVSQRLRESEQALADLKTRLTVVEREMQVERQQKVYIAVQSGRAQQSIEAGATPQELFQSRPDAEAETQPDLEWTICKCEDDRTQNTSAMDVKDAEPERVRGLEARGLEPLNSRLAELLLVAEERAETIEELEKKMHEFQVRTERLQIQLAEECVKFLDEETRNKALVQENEALREDAAGLRVQFTQVEQDRLNMERMLATAQALESESGTQRQHTLWTRINELQSENEALYRSVCTGQERVAALELNEESLKGQLVLLQREIMECTSDLLIAHQDMQAVGHVQDVSIGEKHQHQNNHENEAFKSKLLLSASFQGAGGGRGVGGGRGRKSAGELVSLRARTRSFSPVLPEIAESVSATSLESGANTASLPSTNPFA
jgi:hypothetical protein